MLDTSNKRAAASPTQDDAEDRAESSKLHLGVSSALDKCCAQKHQAEVQRKKGNENSDQSDERIETKVKC